MKNKLNPVGLKPDDGLFEWWDRKEREWKEIVRTKVAEQNKKNGGEQTDISSSPKLPLTKQ